jgi:hypothetical protein
MCSGTGLWITKPDRQPRREGEQGLGVRCAPVKWGSRGADLGRLTRSRGMGNERQAIRWGIPSQFFQWLRGVAGFVRWFQSVGRQQRLPGWREGRWVAIPVLGCRQAPFQRRVSVVRRGPRGVVAVAWVLNVRRRFLVLRGWHATRLVVRRVSVVLGLKWSSILRLERPVVLGLE